MYTLKVKNNRGESLNLSSNKNYNVYKIEGLNPPQATVNRSVNATSDGSKINSVKLESRNIVIYIELKGDVEASRNNLYKYFPSKKSVTLYYKNGIRDVYIEGVVENFECDPFAQKQIAQISILCGDPYFKDMDYIITNFSDINSMFKFPFSITESGIEISAITSNIRKSILNASGVETGVEITLTAIGTVVNPVIYDVLEKTHIKLNFTMQASDKIIINTNVGQKSVTLIRDGVSYNALGYLQRNSDWFILRSGDNVYAYDSDSGTSNLQITFTANVLYSGV